MYTMYTAIVYLYTVYTSVYFCIHSSNNFYSDSAAPVFPTNMFQEKAKEEDEDEEGLDEPEHEELPDSPE